MRNSRSTPGFEPVRFSHLVAYWHKGSRRWRVTSIGSSRRTMRSLPREVETREQCQEHLRALINPPEQLTPAELARQDLDRALATVRDSLDALGERGVLVAGLRVQRLHTHLPAGHGCSSRDPAAAESWALGAITCPDCKASLAFRTLEAFLARGDA